MLKVYCTDKNNHNTTLDKYRKYQANVSRSWRSGFFFFCLFIPVVSIELRETTLTSSDSTGDPVSMKSEIVRVVSLSKTEVSEITRLTIRSSGYRYHNLTKVYPLKNKSNKYNNSVSIIHGKNSLVSYLKTGVFVAWLSGPAFE